MKKFQLEANQPPIYSWCPSLEDGVLDAMAKIAALPFVKHLALMPDAHVGMEMPIGGVVACENVIVPQFVGVDIGCGMTVAGTNLQRSQFVGLEAAILERLSANIPVGFAHNSPAMAKVYAGVYSETPNDDIPADQAADVLGKDLYSVVADQVGTLGGGNHFLELQQAPNGFVQIMIHSGSRNIGKQVCDHFTLLARALNDRWISNSSIPFLPVSSQEGQDYIAWMEFCLWFSKTNKLAMLCRVEEVLKEFFPQLQMEVAPLVVHHNYAALENHMGHNWWVHRKGATSARKDQPGIIPGSMGTSSYITQGLGNVLSLNSCSHGAGRRMGRADFNRSIDSAEKRAEVAKSLEGVAHLPFTTPQRRGKKDGGRAVIDCSEAPGAYKNIDEVMENQADLTQGVIKLTPFLCLKG